jgi:N-acyl-D-aspartate/D-glutamate deacylase|tara:strand:+ start:2594 stop:2878 length:285 start_codon:yes stop_codon:yes gene_type:complete
MKKPKCGTSVILEMIVQGRGIYSKCENIEEMIDVLTEEIENLKSMQKLEVDMKPNDDDRIVLTKAVVVGTKAYDELKDHHCFYDITHRDLEIPY